MVMYRVLATTVDYTTASVSLGRVTAEKYGLGSILSPAGERERGRHEARPHRHRGDGVAPPRANIMGHEAIKTTWYCAMTRAWTCSSASVHRPPGARRARAATATASAQRPPATFDLDLNRKKS